MRIEDIKIGQRIALTKEAEMYCPNRDLDFKAGARGTIIFIDRNQFFEDLVLIEFDDYINGHDGYHYGSDIEGKDGHCWWFPEENLIRIVKTLKRKNNY